MTIICQFIFAFICNTLINLDSPTIWPHQEAYGQVLGNLPRVSIASFIAILSGAFINSYALMKWKILLKGKYFWLRSMGSSAIGEFIFTFIAYIMEFSGITSLQNILQLIAISFAVKIILDPLLVVPAMIFVKILKKLKALTFMIME